MYESPSLGFHWGFGDSKEAADHHHRGNGDNYSGEGCNKEPTDTKSPQNSLTMKILIVAQASIVVLMVFFLAPWISASLFSKYSSSSSENNENEDPFLLFHDQEEQDPFFLPPNTFSNSNLPPPSRSPLISPSNGNDDYEDIDKEAIKNFRPPALKRDASYFLSQYAKLSEDEEDYDEDGSSDEEYDDPISYDGFSIPRGFTSPFGSYPNPLDITEEERDSFFPVVEFPSAVWPEMEEEIQVNDKTLAAATELATEEERKERRTQGKNSKKKKGKYSIGRYDENRETIYSSPMFLERTVHVGIDLEGPLGTAVHAFTDGVIHSAGYNPELGDYGNVIVVEHPLVTRKVWALYGHLDSESVHNTTKGKSVKGGQVLGHLGDIHENGGWIWPHVHFQLSLNEPQGHDLPGVVALEDRNRALIDYPDPRYVLGELY